MCLIASMLGLMPVGVFAESSEKEVLENAVAPLEEVVVVGRFRSRRLGRFARH